MNIFCKTFKIYTIVLVLTIFSSSNCAKDIVITGGGERVDFKAGERVKIWDISDRNPQNWRKVRTLTGHSGTVMSMAFNHDGTKLALGLITKPYGVKIWDTSDSNPYNWQEMTTLTSHRDEISSVAFNHNGTRLASGSSDRTIRIWNTSDSDPHNWQEITTLTSHRDKISSVAFNHNGTRLASGSSDRTIRIWDTSNWQEMTTLTDHRSKVYSVAFSHNGTRLASGAEHGKMKIWNTSDIDPRNWKVVRTVTAIEYIPLLYGEVDPTLCFVSSIAFNHDGTRLAFGSGEPLFGEDRAINIWDISDIDPRNWQEVKRLTGNKDRIASLAFSHDGAKLASGAGSGQINIWDTSDIDPRNWQLLKILRHVRGVYSVVFKPKTPEQPAREDEITRLEMITGPFATRAEELQALQRRSDPEKVKFRGPKKEIIIRKQEDGEAASQSRKIKIPSSLLFKQ